MEKVKTNENSFDPNDHLIPIKSGGKVTDYLPVKWRLKWFREEHPHGKIETALLNLDMERGLAIFHATVEDGDGGMASGHGSETVKDFGDFIEKAETKAIGRALAALGYGTQFAPELDEGERIVDAPVQRQASETRKSEQMSSASTSAGNQTSRPSGDVGEASKQPANVVTLIGKAKERAKVLGIGWSVIKMNSGTGNVIDEELTIQHIGKINGFLAAKEREKQGAA